MINCKMKRFIAIVLVFCMVLSYMPCEAMGQTVNSHSESSANGKMDGSIFDFTTCTKEQKLSVLRSLIYETSDGKMNLKNNGSEEYGDSFDFSAMSNEEKKDKAIEILKTIEDINVDFDKVLADNESKENDPNNTNKEDENKESGESKLSSADYDVVRQSLIKALTGGKSDPDEDFDLQGDISTGEEMLKQSIALDTLALNMSNHDDSNVGEYKTDGRSIGNLLETSRSMSASNNALSGEADQGPQFAITAVAGSNSFIDSASGELRLRNPVDGNPHKGVVELKITRTGDMSDTQTVYYRVFKGTITAEDYVPRANGEAVIFAPGETQKTISVNYDFSGSDSSNKKGYYGNAYLYGRNYTNSSFPDKFYVEMYKIDGTGSFADGKSAAKINVVTNNNYIGYSDTTGIEEVQNDCIYNNPIEETIPNVSKGATKDLYVEVPQWMKDSLDSRGGSDITFSWKTNKYIDGSVGGVYFPRSIVTAYYENGTSKVLKPHDASNPDIIKGSGENYYYPEKDKTITKLKFTVKYPNSGTAKIYAQTNLEIIDDTAPILKKVHIDNYDSSLPKNGKVMATFEFNDPVAVRPYIDPTSLPGSDTYPIFSIPVTINGAAGYMDMKYANPGNAVSPINGLSSNCLVYESIETLKPGTVIAADSIPIGSVYMKDQCSSSEGRFIRGVETYTDYIFKSPKTYISPVMTGITAEPQTVPFEKRNDPVRINITGTGFNNPDSRLQAGMEDYSPKGPFFDLIVDSDTTAHADVYLPPNTKNSDSSVRIYSFADYVSMRNGENVNYVWVACSPRVPVDSMTLKDSSGADLDGTTIGMYAGSTQKLTAEAKAKVGETLPPSFPGVIWSLESSGSENIATIDQGGTITALAEGTIKITAKSEDMKFLEDNGVEVSNNDKKKYIKSVTVNITANPNPPGIDIDKSLETTYTTLGSDAAAFWGSSVHAADRVYTVKLIEYSSDSEYPADGSLAILWQGTVTGKLSMAIPKEELTNLSPVANGVYTPAYTVYISSPQESTGALMKGKIDIVVKPKPVKVTIPKDKATGYAIYDENSTESTYDISFDIENETPNMQRKYVLRKNGAEPSTSELTENTASIPINTKPDKVKDTYSLTVMANNGSGWSTDTCIFYVYNPDCFKVHSNGSAVEKINMSNIDKLSGKTEDEIVNMLSELPLLQYAKVPGNWGGDMFTWESSNTEAVKLLMPAGGFLPTPDSTLMAYRYNSEVGISGVGDGSSTITVTHVKTNKKFTFDVTVASVKDKLYIFKSVAPPVDELTLTYTDGRGNIQTRTAAGKSTVAVYDQNGIHSDVSFKGVDKAEDSKEEDITYTGFIKESSVITGEGSGTVSSEDPYATNRYRLFPLTNISLTLVNDHYRNATGKFDVNSMVVAGDTVYAHGTSKGVTVHSNGIVRTDDVNLASISADELAAAGQIRFCYEILPADDATKAKYAPVYTEICRNIDEEFGKIDASVRIRSTQKSQAYIYDQSFKNPDNKFWRDASVRTDPLYFVEDSRAYDMMARVNWLGGESGSARLFNSSEEDVTDKAALEIKDISYKDTEGNAFANLTNKYSQVTFRVSDDMVKSSEHSNHREKFTIKIYDTDGNMLQSEKLPFDFINITHMSMKEIKDEGGLKLDFTGTMDSGAFDSNVAGMNNMEIGLPIDLPISFEVEMDEDDPFKGTFTGTIGGNKGSDFLSGDTYSKEEFEKKASKAEKTFAERKKEAGGEKDWDISVCGYIEGDVKYEIAEDAIFPEWKLVPTGGGLLVEASMSYEYSVTTFVVFIPIYYGIEVGGSLSLDFNISEAAIPEGVEDPTKLENNGDLACDFKFTVVVAGYFKASAGIGFDFTIIAFKIGVFGQVSLAVANSTLKSYYKQVIDNTDYSLSNGTKVNLELGAGIELMFKLLFISYETTLIDGSIEWEWHWDHKGYCTFGNEASGDGGEHKDNPSVVSPESREMHVTGMRLAESNAAPKTTTSIGLEGRDYMKNPQTWLGGGARGRLASDSDPVIWENSYPYAYPSITTDGNMSAMLYDNSSTDINNTKTAYSTYSNGTWSAPAVIDNDDTPDSNLNMKGSSDFAVATWEDMREKIDTTTRAGEEKELTNSDIVKMMNNSEIKASVYQNGAWTTTKITDDYRSDMAPRVSTDGSGNAIVVWQKVSPNNVENPLDMGGGNELWYSVYKDGAWSAEKLLDSGDSGDTKSISVATAKDGTSMIVMGVETATDTENSAAQSSPTGREIYYYLINADGTVSEKVRMTNDNNPDTNPQVTVMDLDGTENFITGWYTKSPVYGDVAKYDHENPSGEATQVPSQPVRDENGNVVTEKGVVYEKNDIMLRAMATDGTQNTAFPDSISEINNAGGVTITENFKLVQGSGGGASDFGIAWVGTESTLIEGDDKISDKYIQNQNISVARFMNDEETNSIRVSAPVVVTSLKGGEAGAVAETSNEVLDSFDACMIPNAVDNSVEFKAVYAKTAYAYTEAAINEAIAKSTLEEPAAVFPEGKSYVCSAAATLKNNIEITEVAFDNQDLYVGSSLDMGIDVFNKGVSTIDGFDATIEGETYHIDETIKPNESGSFTVKHAVKELKKNTVEITANFADNATATDSYDVNFAITDIGMGESRIVKAENGKRIIQVKLNNNSNMPLENSGYKIELSAYEDMQRKNPVAVIQAPDEVASAVTFAATEPEPIIISDNERLGLIDQGAASIFVEYDASSDFIGDSTDKYLYLYAKIVDADGNRIDEAVYSNNNGAVHIGNPKEIYDEQFDVKVYQASEESGTTADIDVKNNYLEDVQDAYLIAKLYDAEGNELESVNQSLSVGPESEETKSVSFAKQGKEIKAYVSRIPQITEFAMATSPSAIGSIKEATKKIEIDVPYGTDITNVAADFKLAGQEGVGNTGATVTVDGIIQESGKTTNDFSKEEGVVYKIEKFGESTEYTVKVKVTEADTDAALSSLSYTINGVTEAVPDFKPEQSTYYVGLSTKIPEDAHITLVPVLNSTKTEITANSGITLSGGRGTATVETKAQSGATVKYTVEFGINTAEITVSDKVHTYDSSPKFISVVTSPAGISCVISYSQNGEAVSIPTEAGVYNYKVSVIEENFTGSASGTLTIKKAGQEKPNVNIEGTVTANSITVTSPIGDNYEYSIDGSTYTDSPIFAELLPENKYTVSVRLKGDSNHNPSEPETKIFTTSKPAPGITEVEIIVSNKVHTYDGSPKAISAVTSPTGISCKIGYSQNDETVSNPTEAGTYNYTVTVIEENFTGSASGTLTIKKAGQEKPNVNIEGTVTANSITVTSPIGDNYEYSIDGSTYTDSPIFAELLPENKYTVSVRLKGDSNHNPSEPETKIFTTSKLAPGITEVEIIVSNKVHTYDGSPKAISVVTSPAGISCVISYSQNGEAVSIPTEAGVYNYKVSVIEENFTGSAVGTMTIENAEQDKPDKPDKKPEAIVTTEKEVSKNNVQTTIKVNDGILRGDKLSAYVDSKTIDEAIKQSINAGKDMQSPSAEIEINVMAGTSGNTVNKSEIQISQASVAEIGNKTRASLKLTTPVGQITLENKLLKDISETDNSGVITITAEKINNDGEVSYEFSLKAAGGKTYDLNGTTARIKMPYELKHGDDANSLTMTYIGADYLQHTLKYCIYDENEKAIIANIKDLAYFTVTCDKSDFSDLSRSWAENEIDFVFSHGIMDGIGESKFSPDSNVTRAMFVTTLYRLSGAQYGVNGQKNFSDVASGSWYEDAVYWAYENGILKGTGESEFSPDMSITREQMVLIVSNYLKHTGRIFAADQHQTFEDEYAISPYAVEAVRIMNSEGIIKGRTDNCFDPAGSATRAEMAAILHRIIKAEMK